MTHLSTDIEKEDLLNSFVDLDEDCDGILTKEDLMKAYRDMGKDPAEVEDIVDSIMSNVDVGKSGVINYSEFVAASMSKKKFFSDERLKTAFQMFDQDADGFISVEELRSVFNKGCFANIDDKLFVDLMSDSILEVEDGQEEEPRISYEIFKEMMLSFSSNEQFTQTMAITQTLAMTQNLL